jgi:hypothetical protein
VGAGTIILKEHMSKSISIPLVAAVVGLLVGRFVLQPPVKIQTKEVVKYVERKQEDKKKNVVIVERRLKDGSVEKRTEIKEAAKSVTDSKLDSTKQQSIKKGSGVTVGVLALKDLANPSETDYGMSVTVPVHGALKIQGFGTTGKQVGIGIAVEF